MAFNIESGAELEVLMAKRRGMWRRVARGLACDSRESGRDGGRTSAHFDGPSPSQIWRRLGRGAATVSRAQKFPLDQWRGITSHIGSQILSVAPYRRALTRLASYVRDLAREGIRLEHVDIGGGFGVRYTNEAAVVPAAFARALAEIVRPLGCRLLIEPGRAIVGPAGVLLTRVST